MSEHTHSSMLPEGFLLAGRYRIDKYLSSGGCGNTYLVTDMKFARSRTRVVIKEFFLAERTYRSTGSSRVVVTNPDNQQMVTKLRSKFKREAELIFSLKHPNIVSVSDIFDANDTSYYVMQYVEGGSLAKKLKDEGPLAEEDALRYIRQVLSALYVMHAEGLYHLDLKPANIMLDAYDNAVLIDFGASKIADDDSGKFSTTTPLYTRGFAPAEQIEGVLSRLGAWTDIYAVGATLYSLLSGMAPPMPSEILERGEEAFALSDDVSPRTQKAIAAFMQQSRSKRPQSVEEAEALLFGKVQKHITPKKVVTSAAEDFETQLPGASTPEVVSTLREEMVVENTEGNEKTRAAEFNVSTKEKEELSRFGTILPTADEPQPIPVKTSPSTNEKNYWLGIALVLVALVIITFVLFALYGGDNSSIPTNSPQATALTDSTAMDSTPIIPSQPLVKEEPQPAQQQETYDSYSITKGHQRGDSVVADSVAPIRRTPKRRSQRSTSTSSQPSRQSRSTSTSHSSNRSGIGGRQIGSGGGHTQSSSSNTTPPSSGGLNGKRIGN